MNLSSSLAKYVFNPVSSSISEPIATANVLMAIYGCVANSLILYFFKRKGQISISKRFSTTFLFIESLALSDVLSTLITIPLFTAEMFHDFVKTDMLCQVLRYFIILFPCVTVMNYVLIGTEKYMCVFYPFCVPNSRTCRRLVLLAWLTGGLLTIQPCSL